MKHVLGSVRLVRRTTLACLLATGAQLACGKVGPVEDDGPASGGSLPKSADDGTTAAGGQATGTGGTLQIDPDYIDDPLPLGPCDDPQLDPPCNDDDLHGSVIQCVGTSVVSFDLPLTDVLPPKGNLRVLGLPLDSSLGAGGVEGMGGAGSPTAAPLVLEASSLSPATAGEIHDDSFDLSAPAASAAFGIHFTEWPDDYLESHDPGNNWYSVGQIALVDGETILSQRRLLVDYGYACTK